MNINTTVLQPSAAANSSEAFSTQTAGLHAFDFAAADAISSVPPVTAGSEDSEPILCRSERDLIDIVVTQSTDFLFNAALD